MSYYLIQSDADDTKYWNADNEKWVAAQQATFYTDYTDAFQECSFKSIDGCAYEAETVILCNEIDRLKGLTTDIQDVFHNSDKAEAMLVGDTFIWSVSVVVMERDNIVTPLVQINESDLYWTTGFSV